MSELKELIAKAKQKNVTAMEKLFNQFKPLLKSRAKKYSRYGLE
jgi:DNA-directed RNA polymerase specialized sigma subunit